MLALVVGSLSTAASADILVVQDFNQTATILGPLSSTAVSSTTFNAMSLATLSSFDTIFLDSQFVSFASVTNPNLGAAVGVNNVAGAGRIYLAGHDAVGHAAGTNGAKALVRNALAWTSSGQHATGLVFVNELGTLVPSAFPAAWGLAFAVHNGDDADILPAFEGTHPIYAGPHGNVTDFPTGTSTSLNWSAGHHNRITAFNAGIFTKSENDTSSGFANGLIRGPAPIPAPGATMLGLIGLGAIAFTRRRCG